MKNIVTQEWLLQNMFNENLVILDARAVLTDSEKGMELYREGHIKGAQFVSMKEVMSGELTEHSGRNPLPVVEKLADDMKNQNEIVVYCGSGISSIVNLLLLDEIGIKAKLFPGSYSEWVSYLDNPVI